MGGKRQALGEMDPSGGYTLKILVANKSAGSVIGKAGTRSEHANKQAHAPANTHTHTHMNRDVFHF